jgi:hypothetical protein
LGSQAFGLLFLVSNVPQALLQAGDLAEPLHPLGLSQAPAGVGLDFQQPGLLGQVEAEQGAPDAGVFMLARCPIGPVAGAERDLAQAEISLHLSTLILDRVSRFADAGRTEAEAVLLGLFVGELDPLAVHGSARSNSASEHPLLPMSGHLALGWRGKPQLAGWIGPGYFRYETVA